MALARGGESLVLLWTAQARARSLPEVSLWLRWMGQTLGSRRRCPGPQYQCAYRGSAGWGRPWVLAGGALGRQHQCACRGFSGWGRPWVREGGVLVPNTSVPTVAPLDGADPGSPTPVCLPWLRWMGQTLDMPRPTSGPPALVCPSWWDLGSGSVHCFS